MAVLGPWDPACVSDDCAGGGGSARQLYGPFGGPWDDNLTNQPLFVVVNDSLDSPGNSAKGTTVLRVIRAGSISGISVVLVNGNDGIVGALTAGTLDFKVTVNGADSGYGVSLGIGDDGAQDSSGSVAVVAGDDIGVMFDSSADIATDADNIVVLIEVTAS